MVTMDTEIMVEGCETGLCSQREKLLLCLVLGQFEDGLR